MQRGRKMVRLNLTDLENEIRNNPIVATAFHMRQHFAGDESMLIFIVQNLVRRNEELVEKCIELSSNQSIQLTVPK